MEAPPVRYARNGNVHIAYTVVGNGAIDLVYAPGIWTNCEIVWEEPRWARYLHRIACFSRLIMFDMRGLGLSDRGHEPPVVEVQMADAAAVMDDVGIESAACMGMARGGSTMALFAATYPERVRSLVLYAPIARTMQAPDHPIGWTEDRMAVFAETLMSSLGTGRNLELQGTGSDDARFVQWWGRFERLLASRQSMAEIGAILRLVDV